MNQIAGVDGFNLMNNLRLVIIVAIFIGIIIALLLNWILRARRRAKLKDRQAVNQYDNSSREERHVPGVVDDFSGMEESMEKEKIKGGESTAEPEVEIDGQQVVNYKKIEADLKAIRNEVTTKIKGLILKVEEVEEVEKAVLNKIEDVIDAKIREASNKINDSLTEVLRTQRSTITSVSEEQLDSLRKEEVPADILPSEAEDTVMSEEIKEKEQTDTIVPSGKIEENISEGDLGESVDFDIQKLLEEEPVGMSYTEESREVVEEEVDEKEPIEAVTLSGEIEEKISKISEGDVGESVDFDVQKLLEEEPVGISFTEESREVVEGKVEFKKEKERDLELPTEETIAHEGVDAKEIDILLPPGDIKEKALETAKGEGVEEKKQSTGETVDSDIQEFLEELGTLPSEKE